MTKNRIYEHDAYQIQNVKLINFALMVILAEINTKNLDLFLDKATFFIKKCFDSSQLIHIFSSLAIA